MPDISPNNSFLEHTWLTPAGVIGQFEPRTIVEIYNTQPVELAKKIDEFALMPPEQAGAHSQIADILADTISWETMRPKYIEAFEALCQA
jgi:hypothetical protein